MQPRLPRRVVVAGIDGFVVDVRVVTAQARDLLCEAGTSVGHEIGVAAIPELVPMTDGSGDTAAGRFDGVLCDRLRIDGREFPVPVNDLVRVAVQHVVHTDRQSMNYSTAGLVTFAWSACAPAGATSLAVFQDNQRVV